MTRAVCGRVSALWHRFAPDCAVLECQTPLVRATQWGRVSPPPQCPDSLWEQAPGGCLLGEAWPASRLSLAGRTFSATCAVVATGATQVGAFKGTASARQGWLWAGRVPSKAECLLARRVLTCKPGFL